MVFIKEKGRMKRMETNEMQTNEMTKKPKKKSGAWKAIVAVILILGVAGSTTVSAFNLMTLQSYIAKQEEEEKLCSL